LSRLLSCEQVKLIDIRASGVRGGSVGVDILTGRPTLARPRSTKVPAAPGILEDRRSPHWRRRKIGPMSDLLPRARAAQARAAKRWYVYLILCRSGAVYTGIARNVTVRYAQHIAGTGARYTRANPPRRLLVKFACLNQSAACRMEAAIKKLTAINKRKLVGKTGTEVRKILLG